MLEVRNLGASYGDFEVLHAIDLTVGEGKVVALLGHNGAGKSALLKAIFGLLPVTAGKVSYDGVDATGARPFEKSALGIRFVPQEGNVFPSLSVEDNLRLGALKMSGAHAAVSGAHAAVSGTRAAKMSGARAAVNARIAEIFETFPILRERRAAPARVLSGGERQMLAMSIALMTAPKLLLLDEPSSGLAPIAVHRLFEMIETIHQRSGAAVLLVEQNVNEALRLAGEVYVLEEGRLVFHGASSDKEQVVRHLWRLAGKDGASNTN